jgi:hypothetical protein
MAGRHGTRDGQPPATTVIIKSKLGGSVLAPPHPATSLSNHDNNQLGEEAPHYIELSISFPFILLFLGFLKKDE